jgi:hypothetical protein
MKTNVTNLSTDVLLPLPVNESIELIKTNVKLNKPSKPG